MGYASLKYIEIVVDQKGTFVRDDMGVSDCFIWKGEPLFYCGFAV